MKLRREKPFLQPPTLKLLRANSAPQPNFPYWFSSLHSALCSALLLARPTDIGEPAKRRAIPHPACWMLWPCRRRRTQIQVSAPKHRPPTGAVSFAGHSCGHTSFTLHMPWTWLNLPSVVPPQSCTIWSIYYVHLQIELKLLRRQLRRDKEFLFARVEMGKRWKFKSYLKLV